MKIPSQRNSASIEYTSAINPNNGAKIITKMDLSNACTLKIVALCSFLITSPRKSIEMGLRML